MSAMRAILALVVIGAITIGPGLIDDPVGSTTDPEFSTASGPDIAPETSVIALADEPAFVDSPSEPIATRRRPVRLGRIVPPLPRRVNPKVEPQRSITMAFTGDMIPHGAVTRQASANGGPGAYDFGPMLTYVAPYIERADIGICHLESPLSPDSTNISGYPQFNAPRELAEGVKAIGYDGCSLASNHSYDRRESGVVNTVDVMEETGLGFTGMARNAEEASTPRLYKANGITVGHLSYTYSLNGFSLPAGKGYLANLIDPDAIEAEATAARSAGAHIVVVSMHWGDEYRSTPSRYQEDLANRLMAHADIDLIVGHHAHVVQPIDTRGPEGDQGFVIFGLGNFLSNQSSACCVAASQDGVIVMVTFTETARGQFDLTSGCIEPTWVDRTDYAILTASDKDRPAPDYSAERTRNTMGSAGAFDKGFAQRCAR